MCFQKREFFDLENPEFDDEIMQEIPVQIQIEILIQPSDHNTDIISRKMLKMALLKMKRKLKELMIGLGFLLLRAHSLLLLLLLFLLPLTPPMVFIIPDQILPSDTGCPEDAKCNIACQEDPRFNTTGSCVGPDRMLCTCGPPRNTTDQPQNVQATACNNQECEWKCAGYRIPMTGKCTEGVCKCGYKVTVTGIQPTGFILSKNCLVPCCLPFLLTYGFKCHDEKVSAMKWTDKWRKQVAVCPRVTPAEEVWEGTMKNASEKCVSRSVTSETKIPTINMKL